MRIQHNIMALNAHRQFAGNTNEVQKNIERLSSGYSINRAGDDASGLAISEKMRAQIKGLEVAQKNAQDGISLIQTAEGALTEVHSMLNRMVELAEKSANGTIQDDVDREAIQKEVNDLLSEIDRISKATNFNGINLLDGTLGASKAANTATADIGAVNSKVTMSGLDIGTVVTFTTAASTDTASSVAVEYNAANKALTITLTAVSGGDTTFTADDINNAILEKYASDPVKYAALAGVKVESGNVVAKDDSTNEVLGSIIFKEAAASTKAKDIVGLDTDFVLSATKTGATGIKAFTFTASTVQGITNSGGTVSITLEQDTEYSASQITEMLKSQGIDWKVSFDGTVKGSDIAGTSGFGNGTYAVTDGTGSGASGLTLQIGDSNDSYQKVTVSVDNLSSDGLGIANLDVSTREAAGEAIAKIKAAINKVSTNRANLGGLQNRLEHTINNLSVTEENMTAAESRIRDVDMAKEMMAFTKNNVLAQAAQAMLAQANTQPQSVLQLLQ